MKNKISFIINPISGGINKQSVPALIEKHLNHDRFHAEILFTKEAADTSRFSKEAVQKGSEIVVAVGGDGTINQVAKNLIHTSTALGIIPLGSGNGFARHLKIPLNPAKALDVLNKGTPRLIDTATANGECFVNVAGAGFDAHVAWKFSTAPKRGFLSYAKITLNEFRNYALRKYELEIDGRHYGKKAFLVCFSNGDQYGNNAFIAPAANMHDGLLDITILKEVRLLTMPGLAYKMFTRKLDHSKYVEILRGKNILIRREAAEVVNIDGEPYQMERDITIKLLPASLSVITV